jgi:Uma2 family endonuclease
METRDAAMHCILAMPAAGDSLAPMNSLLEIPAIRQRAARISVQDYHRLGELPVELLRGTIIDKMSKSPLHSSVAADLLAILSSQISDEFILRAECPLTLVDSEPEPDLCVIRGNRADFRATHPTTAALVIEVAVSSLELDRVKALIYAEAGVAEYWIVRPVEKLVEIYRSPGPAGYAHQSQAGPEEVLECEALPGVRVPLAEVLR